jgi:hypothetical protein
MAWWRCCYRCDHVPLWTSLEGNGVMPRWRWRRSCQVTYALTQARAVSRSVKAAGQLGQSFMVWKPGSENEFSLPTPPKTTSPKPIVGLRPQPKLNPTDSTHLVNDRGSVRLHVATEALLPEAPIVTFGLSTSG